MTFTHSERKKRENYPIFEFWKFHLYIFNISFVVFFCLEYNDEVRKCEHFMQWWFKWTEIDDENTQWV